MPDTCKHVMGEGQTHWYCGAPLVRAGTGSCQTCWHAKSYHDKGVEDLIAATCYAAQDGHSPCNPFHEYLAPLVCSEHSEHTQEVAVDAN